MKKDLLERIRCSRLSPTLLLLVTWHWRPRPVSSMRAQPRYLGYCSVWNIPTKCLWYKIEADSSVPHHQYSVKEVPRDHLTSPLEKVVESHRLKDNNSGYCWKLLFYKSLMEGTGTHCCTSASKTVALFAQSVDSAMFLPVVSPRLLLMAQCVYTVYRLDHNHPNFTEDKQGNETFPNWQRLSQS